MPEGGAYPWSRATAAGQRLFTEAFQGRRPSLDLLRGAWEVGGKRLASWASWLRQQQLVRSFESVIGQPQGVPAA